MLRYERKYYVHNSRLDELRSRMMPFLRPDIFAKKNDRGHGEYTVRSIYYDTPFMDFYYEKMEGLKDRNKFRIRVYDQYEPGNLAFLEVKQKLGPRIKKHRATTEVMDVVPLLRTADVDTYIKSDPKGASKFLFHYYKNALKPVNLVVYEREPYHGKFDSGVRITLDKNVRSAIYPKMEGIYNEGMLKPITPEYFILEIKYFYHFPCWCRSVLEEFDTRLEAISKYATGIDIHHQHTSQRFSPIGFTSISDS